MRIKKGTIKVYNAKTKRTSTKEVFILCDNQIAYDKDGFYEPRIMPKRKKNNRPWIKYDNFFSYYRHLLAVVRSGEKDFVKLGQLHSKIHDLTNYLQKTSSAVLNDDVFVANKSEELTNMIKILSDVQREKLQEAKEKIKKIKTFKDPLGRSNYGALKSSLNAVIRRIGDASDNTKSWLKTYRGRLLIMSTLYQEIMWKIYGLGEKTLHPFTAKEFYEETSALLKYQDIPSFRSWCHHLRDDLDKLKAAILADDKKIIQQMTEKIVVSLRIKYLQFNLNSVVIDFEKIIEKIEEDKRNEKDDDPSILIPVWQSVEREITKLKSAKLNDHCLTAPVGKKAIINLNSASGYMQKGQYQKALDFLREAVNNI